MKNLEKDFFTPRYIMGCSYCSDSRVTVCRKNNQKRNVFETIDIKYEIRQLAAL